MTEQLLEPRAIGRDLVRRDGAAKVRGTAHLRLRDRRRAPGATAIPCRRRSRGGASPRSTRPTPRPLDGVLAVLTHRRRRAPRRPPTTPSWRSCRTTRSPSAGSSIGVVVAETSEVARQAADLVRVAYDEEASRRRALRRPRRPLHAGQGQPGVPDRHRRGRRRRGDGGGRGHRRADVHDADVAQQPDGAARDDRPVGRLRPAATLTLWDSTQGVHRRAQGHRGGLRARPRAGAGHLPRTSAAGSAPRGTPHANVVLAAHGRPRAARPAGAARADPPADVLPGRLPHPDDPADAGSRADRDGRAARRSRIDVVEQTSTDQGVRRADRRAHPDDVRRAEPPHHAPAGRARRRRCPRGCAPPASARACSGPRWRWTSSPRPSASTRSSCGSATSPRSTPRRASRGPAAGSSSACARARERFGWAERDPRPGVRRRGDWLVGTGVAARSTRRMRHGPSRRPRIALRRTAATSPRSAPPTSAPAPGPCSPQIAADALGVPVERRRGAHRRHRLPDRDGRRRLVGHGTWGSADRRGGPGVPATSSATAPTDGDEAARRGRAGRERGLARHVRLRRPVRRGARERRHRRDPGAAAARRVRRRPHHQPADRPDRSSSAA